MNQEFKQREIDSFRDIMNCLQDSRNWKEPTRYIEVATEEEALRIAKALSYFTGGAEVVKKKLYKIKRLTDDYELVTRYVVGSKGYYHYIGA